MPGINPQALQGTDTGVYVGVCNYPNDDGYPETIQPDLKNDLVNSLQILTNFKSLYANRISFTYDFKGPSMIADTACSSSMSAFYLAINDFLLGEFNSFD